MKNLFLCLFLISCSTGPKSQDKSLLNKLNGENYRSDVDAGIPLNMKSVSRNTILTGTCYFRQKDDDFRYPVKFKEVSLLKNGKVMTTTSTDQSGHFTISAPLENGIYDLAISSGSYQGIHPVTVNGYSVKEIEFLVTKE